MESDRMPRAVRSKDVLQADCYPAFGYVPAIPYLRPSRRPVDKAPPCAAACAVGGDVRGWIGLVAQRRKLGVPNSEAYARAWSMLAAVNPFPATLGRICPHPCESGCMRTAHGGAVAINALERFLGDWALRAGLPLPMLEKHRQPESIGVIGAGPAGLSFAYQMARRGYRTTIYEAHEKPGGMLNEAIPSFRLPANVLEAEIRRIVDLGVRLRLNTVVGRDISPGELRSVHSVVFVGIGAADGIPLNIPGERGDGVWLGIEYLRAVKRKKPVALGSQVVVIGGGNTAVDAARAARRGGANVTILYRRTSAEMPANANEIEAALSEGVVLQCLSVPVSIARSSGIVTAVVAQRTRLAEPDASGRRRPLPEAGGQFTLPADCVIVAISQRSDWRSLEEFLVPDRREAWRGIDLRGIHVAAGGDALNAGIAGVAIAHGRLAAEAIHAKLRRLADAPALAADATSAQPAVKAEYYAANERSCIPSRPVNERLQEPDAEVEQTLGERAFLAEATRCLSCGLCFGCEQCFMYCSASAFRRLQPSQPGAYFALDLGRCEGCGKCVELCPSGFLGFGQRVATWMSATLD